ncbi:cation-dependent mannose-6-phosphate receptor-like [Oscarella lobularis]|uniref:cation-dependent mannose-6-phosphate receptor-like n=1 Tax=Oscarella lobularis TaxID=121494 RepID=UPI003314439A
MTRFPSFLRRLGRGFLFLLAMASLSARAQPPADQSQCKTMGTCKCRYGNNTMIDLTPLNGAGKPRFNVSDGSFYYAVDLCSEFHAKFCENGASVCQTKLDYSDGWVCGRIDGSDFTLSIDNETETLYYDLNDGDQSRKSRITLVCDESEEGTMQAFGDAGTLSYNFKLTSKYACPVHFSSGLSGGSYLLIIFFSLVVTYFVVGILVMKFGKKAEGKEIIPNSGLWLSIPSLVKEGVVFLWHKIRGNGNGKQSYEPI